MHIITDFFKSTFQQIVNDCRAEPDAMRVMRRTLRPALIMVAVLLSGFGINWTSSLFS